jgi:hypothetical protein
LLIGLVTAVAVAAAAGCGSSDKSGTTGASNGQSTQPPTSTLPDALPAALRPRCGVERFGKPQVTPNTQFGGWRLLYVLPGAKKRAPRPGEITTFAIEERPPKSARVRYKGETRARVHGRVVDFAPTKNSFTAQWVGKSARYVVIGDGSGTAFVKRLVACLP